MIPQNAHCMVALSCLKSILWVPDAKAMLEA